MNAVKMLDKVEDFFNRNHNLLIKFGGLFAFIFLGIFVPYDMIREINKDLSVQIESYKDQNVDLTTQVNDMSKELKFLRLNYEKKQQVMREVDCLAKNIYFESASEPTTGKIAVAEVTMNRVKSKQFPRSVCAVVYQKTKNTCQFSWVCEDSKTIQNKAAWKESQKIAERILIFDKKYGIIGTAKYFHANYVNPAWAKQKILIRQIGNHIFYE